MSEQDKELRPQSSREEDPAAAQREPQKKEFKIEIVKVGKLEETTGYVLC